MKEIQFSPTIAEYDYQVKLRKILSLIESQQVRVVVTFKGRQMAHVERGATLAARLIIDLQDSAQAVNLPRMQGNRLSVTFNPKK